MSASPSPDVLEQRAAQQRDRLHQTALELISKVDEAKDRLNPERQLREHFTAASLIAGSLALLAGYILAEPFARR